MVASLIALGTKHRFALATSTRLLIIRWRPTALRRVRTSIFSPKHAGACGIPIEWVHAPEGPEAGLTSGKVDLWTSLGDLPERRKILYISLPWSTLGSWLVTLDSSKIHTAEDTAGRSVAHSNISLYARLARSNFPNARLITAGSSNASALEAVCLGTADAAIMVAGSSEVADLRNSGACQNVLFRFIPLAHGDISFGIGASRKRPGARRAADEIQSEIIEMAKDGTLSAISLRWYLYPDTQILTTYYLARHSEGIDTWPAELCLMLMLAGASGLADASAASFSSRG